MSLWSWQVTSAEYNLYERDELAANEPDINHLDVGRWGQLFHDASEDGRHHQHRGQVDRHRRLEVKGLEEGCGVGGEDEEEGGHVGRQHLRGHHPLEDDDHPHSSFCRLQRPLGHPGKNF